MLDRYTARALMNLGRLSPEQYLRLYRVELRTQRDDVLAQREKARHEPRLLLHAEKMQRGDVRTPAPRDH